MPACATLGGKASGRFGYAREFDILSRTAVRCGCLADIAEAAKAESRLGGETSSTKSSHD